MAGFWVFAYGSLMWMPGFEVAESRLARLPDYRRAFALSSVHYRGTPERPGLVLGLDWRPGAHCIGMALRVDETGADEVRHYLASRELVSRAYFEVMHHATLLCDGPGRGEPVEALCYILDRTHPQYAGGLGLDEQAAIIAQAEGPSGPNRDYLFRTVERLHDMRIEDPEITELARLVRARTG
jgi:cation transport protein ChaC